MSTAITNPPDQAAELKEQIQKIILAINGAELLAIGLKKDYPDYPRIADGSEALSRLWNDAYRIKLILNES